MTLASGPLQQHKLRHACSNDWAFCVTKRETRCLWTWQRMRWSFTGVPYHLVTFSLEFLVPSQLRATSSPSIKNRSPTLCAQSRTLCKAKALNKKLREVKDLPKSFGKITAQIDLEKNILKNIQADNDADSQSAPLQSAIDFQGAIDSCVADAKDLNAIYDSDSTSSGFFLLQANSTLPLKP